MGKYKNYILFSLIFLSQIHTLFRGCEFKVVWLLNDISKSLSLTSFLFVKHISEFVVLYCLFRPKGLNKNLVVLFLIITFWDIIHFILLSGFGYEYLKVFLSLITFIAFKSKLNKWIKY